MAALLPAAGAESSAGQIELVGRLVVDRSEVPADLGGLSGIAYDRRRDLYYVISDDRSEHAPARFYTLRLDFSDGSLDADDFAIVATVALEDARGRPFAAGSLDPEGIALAGDGTLYIASEGNAAAGVEPFVGRFTTAGRELGRLPLPERYTPRPDAGVRNNLAFESLTLAPDGTRLFTATENALIQDGPSADLGIASPARILAYEHPSGAPTAEFLYWVDAVDRPPPAPGGSRLAGLCELLALDVEELLALERTHVAGVGHGARLYRVSLRGADDISGIDSLARVDPATLRPARKRLLLDLSTVAAPVENLEGVTFGPPLDDGRLTLVLVGDDNFDPRQSTEILVLAVSATALGDTAPDADRGRHRRHLGRAAAAALGSGGQGQDRHGSLPDGRLAPRHRTQLAPEIQRELIGVMGVEAVAGLPGRQHRQASIGIRDRRDPAHRRAVGYRSAAVAPGATKGGDGGGGARYLDRAEVE